MPQVPSTAERVNSTAGEEHLHKCYWASVSQLHVERRCKASWGTSGRCSAPDSMKRAQL